MKSKFYHFISQPKYIYIIYLLASVVTAWSKYIRGEEAYNNYLIFKNVFWHTWEQRNLYLEYPELYFDSNHYGIFFSLLIAPFAILPDALGGILWNLANAGLLVYAFSKLPFSSEKKAWLGWLCLQEYLTAALSFQFNVGLVALIILSAVYIYERKEVQSAMAILVGLFVKIYGIVGLSSFFFVKNKKRFIGSLILGTFLFLVLPMFISSVEFGVQSYVDWYQSLAEKNMSNQVLYNRQDFSLMGIIRRVLGNPNISNFIFLVPGILVFGLPYLRFKQYQYLPFQMMILASTLLFLVLFSSGSESPTYIIAVIGVMIWFLIKSNRSKWDIGLLIFVMILTCFGSSDLFPRYIKQEYIVKYSLKALPCSLVWFKVIYELITSDFEKDYDLR